MGFFDLLQRSLRIAPRPAVQDNLRVLFQVFVDALEVVSLQSNSGNNAEVRLFHAVRIHTTFLTVTLQAEPRIISAFVELVVKLNEVTFKPLFRKLYDWAFVSDGGESNSQFRFVLRFKSSSWQTISGVASLFVMCISVYWTISRYVAFKEHRLILNNIVQGLMNPYMSFLLQPFVDILKSFRDASSDDLALWTGVVQVLSKTFGFDSGSQYLAVVLRNTRTHFFHSVLAGRQTSSNHPTAGRASPSLCNVQ